MSVPAVFAKRLAPVGIAATALGLTAFSAFAQPVTPRVQTAAAPPVLAGAPSVAARSSSQSGPITITALDYSYDFPEQIQAGFNAFRLVNEGEEPHHAQFVRIKDGVAPQQFFAAAQQSPDAALALVTTEGGPGVAAPGGQVDVAMNLSPGAYVLLCFVESPDGAPHIAKGMAKPFAVTPPPVTAPAPPTDGSVVMRDFSYTVPTIRAGVRTLEVVNEGPQPHETALVKLAPGVSPEEALSNPDAFEQGLATFAGGFQAIDTGKSGWVTVDFTPGLYVAICFVPDPQSGKPHIALGMVQPFEVQ